MRKDAGLELTDRILVTLAEGDADLLDHADWIAREALAHEVAVGTGDQPLIQKSEKTQ
jgi:hypothetical protein